MSSHVLKMLVGGMHQWHLILLVCLVKFALLKMLILMCAKINYSVDVSDA